MAEAKFRVRRGPKDNLPELEEGELAFTTDTGELFVGTGAAENAVVGMSAETSVGAQTKVDAHATATTAHSVGQITGAESIAGAQAKVDAHASAGTAHNVLQILGAETALATQARIDKIKADTGIGGDARSLNSEDLNTVRNGGFYYCYSCTNIPAGAVNGYLITAKGSNGNYTLQIYATHNQSGLFYRNEVNGVWTAWVPLDTAKNIPTVDSGGNIWIA